MLALRANDTAGAKPYIDAAIKAGSKNPVALTDFARVEKDPARAIEILRQALTADPKYAEAHWVFGEKLTDLPRRFAEWKQAVNLAPRNYQWWARFAQLSMDLRQYAEAGRAWVAAAQAARIPKRASSIWMRAEPSSSNVSRPKTPSGGKKPKLKRRKSTG